MKNNDQNPKKRQKKDYQNLLDYLFYDKNPPPPLKEIKVPESDEASVVSDLENPFVYHELSLREILRRKGYLSGILVLPNNPINISINLTDKNQLLVNFEGSEYIEADGHFVDNQTNSKKRIFSFENENIESFESKIISIKQKVLGLLNKRSRSFFLDDDLVHDFVVSYLIIFKELHEEKNKQKISKEDILTQYNLLKDSGGIKDVCKATIKIVTENYFSDNPPNEIQMETIALVLSKKVLRNPIVSKQEVINLYSQIKDLKLLHQIKAYSCGLSADMAIQVNPNQLGAIVSFYEECKKSGQPHSTIAPLVIEHWNSGKITPPNTTTQTIKAES